MEKTKQRSIHLEEIHIKYLSLMAVIHNMTKSEYIRSLLDDDMSVNEEIVKQFEKILY